MDTLNRRIMMSVGRHLTARNFRIQNSPLEPKRSFRLICEPTVSHPNTHDTQTWIMTKRRHDADCYRFGSIWLPLGTLKYF